MAQVPTVQRKSSVIAAIDFGTSHAGCAYSLNAEDADIRPCEWDDLIEYRKACRVPISILFDSAQNFHSFGFESEEKYAELVSDNLHSEWFFFRGFKMLLNGEKIGKSWKIKDNTGQKEMAAKTVFVEAIRVLRNRIIDDVKADYNLQELTDIDVTWLLTVPAIWTDAAKKFMREAAEDAGITREKLVLVYEPEVAAVWCIYAKKYIKYEQERNQMKELSRGDKVILVDVGGGTVDISVQEVQANHRIKVLHSPVGGNKGGTSVNKEFEVMLDQSLLFPLPKTKELKLMRRFEFEKCKYRKGEDELWAIPVSKGFKIKDVPDVELRGKRMLIKPNLVKKFFEPTLECIKENLRCILDKKELDNIDVMMLVGGCANSNFIKTGIRKAFDSQFPVVVPAFPDLAVLKGAIVYGQYQNIIESRVCRYTYGIEVFQTFKDGIHKEDKRYERDGEIVAKNCFRKVYEIDQIVEIGKHVKIPIRDTFRTEERKKKKHDPITVTIFSSKDKNVIHTDDENCTKLGEMIMNAPPKGWTSEANGYVTFEVSRTELLGVLYNSKGQKQDDCKFEFLI